MAAKITLKQNLKDVKNFEMQYRKQKQFPVFPRPYTDYMTPIMHTGYLMFIRNKFLYLAILRSFEDKNIFASYSLLKSYWENVAAFGYYHLRITRLVSESNLEEAFKLSMKMGLGGRGFLTEEMVKNKSGNMDDYRLPNIETMMDKVDKDWQKKLGKDVSMLRELYDSQIAEAGHTTFLGLTISTRWLPDRSQMADVKKSWDKNEYKSILNLMAMSSKIFFHYWNKFLSIPNASVNK